MELGEPNREPRFMCAIVDTSFDCATTCLSGRNIGLNIIFRKHVCITFQVFDQNEHIEVLCSDLSGQKKHGLIYGMGSGKSWLCPFYVAFIMIVYAPIFWKRWIKKAGPFHVIMNNGALLYISTLPWSHYSERKHLSRGRLLNFCGFMEMVSYEQYISKMVAIEVGTIKFPYQVRSLLCFFGMFWCVCWRMQWLTGLIRWKTPCLLAPTRQPLRYWGSLELVRTEADVDSGCAEFSLATFIAYQYLCKTGGTLQCIKASPTIGAVLQTRCGKVWMVFTLLRNRLCGQFSLATTKLQARCYSTAFW